MSGGSNETLRIAKFMVKVGALVIEPAGRTEFSVQTRPEA
jgi:hypothetical protein